MKGNLDMYTLFTMKQLANSSFLYDWTSSQPLWLKIAFLIVGCAALAGCAAFGTLLAIYIPRIIQDIEDIHKFKKEHLLNHK